MAHNNNNGGQNSPFNPASCSNSTMGLPYLALSRSGPIPEQWTLVHEWNIEKRQQRDIDPYVNWQFDVQSQISNMGDKLNKSLHEHPTGDAYYANDKYGKSFEEKRRQMTKDQTRTVTNTLAYGLGRS
ncbi:uncharacterized protein LOC100372287 [Saccoglossus kowalevskii]|uniref:Uncharacterized protein LOC100372287 n=1 Tax=Saccoglossus kowalevskii TaxID=10224 RepID=A0ABM0GY53_SACKO|nr:PREDICTED: uncharacterized protein LOC100372287 [Saccoglossus kowalevskii]